MSQAERRLRILLVDDEAMMLQVVAALLARLGYEAETVDTGEAALARLDAVDFDVVLLDRWMPGMDGLVTLAAIRERNATLPVILCSGQSEASSEADAREAGANAFLRKPFRRDELAEIIERVLGRG